MRLSVKFSGAVLLLLLASLGCVAWLVIRYQTQSLHQRSLERSQMLLSLAESSREYTRQTLGPGRPQGRRPPFRRADLRGRVRPPS